MRYQKERKWTVPHLHRRPQIGSVGSFSKSIDRFPCKLTLLVISIEEHNFFPEKKPRLAVEGIALNIKTIETLKIKKSLPV